MIIHPLLHILFFVGLYGCSNPSDEITYAIHIENGPRQGFQYYDTVHVEYNYRYYTITLTNDTTVPVQLEIGFSEKEMKDNMRSQVFLLPRHLTPARQQYDQKVSAELKDFLDCEIKKNTHLSKTIHPKENCTVTFGVLTDIKYQDPTTPFDSELLISHDNQPTIPLMFKINDTLRIPCGQFSYLKE